MRIMFFILLSILYSGNLIGGDGLTTSTTDADSLTQENYPRVCINGTQYYKISKVEEVYKQSYAYFSLSPVVVDGKFASCPRADYICKKVTRKVRGFFSKYTTETKEECTWVIRK